MTSDELSALRKLCADATPPPWRTGRHVFRTIYSQLGSDDGKLSGVMDLPADAAFTAAARSALPALVDEVAYLQQLQEAIDAKHAHEDARSEAILLKVADERDRLRALLKTIEWQGTDGNTGWCPLCVHSSGEHQADCELAAALK